MTPFMLAVANSHENVASLLIEYEAEINIGDDVSEYPTLDQFANLAGYHRQLLYPFTIVIFQDTSST
jgi:ankyrin repeat protein